MTKSFQEMADNLARAKNFEDGSYLLITSRESKDDIFVSAGGNPGVLLLGIAIETKKLLEEVDRVASAEICAIMSKIVSDEQARRFQEGTVSV